MKIIRSLMKYRGDHCLNCDHPLELTDRYCSRCGQMNSTKKLSFNDFFAEFFSGVFAYDSRFQRTLRVLIFRPGRISKDYINGKRMLYANPFRFYLSASILFFLLFSFSYDFGGEAVPRDRDTPNPAELLTLEAPQVRLDSVNDILKKQNINLDSINLERTPKTYKDHYVTQQTLDTLSFFESINKRVNLYYSFQDETGIYHSDRGLDSLKHEQTNFNQWLYKKTVDAGTFTENPRLFLDYFINQLPFIIFFYLPVFALFIWLLYLRRPFNYMEHLIFAFHVQTMFFVLYGIALLLQMIAEGNWAVTSANFIFLFYLYKAMRNFYGQGRVKTILKFILLNFIFFILAIIAAILSLLASFSIY